MNVTLTPELERIVQVKVKSGKYNSASEVVREALRLMEAHDRYQEAKLKALRKDLQQGLRGPFSSWDVEQFLQQARKRPEKR